MRRFVLLSFFLPALLATSPAEANDDPQRDLNVTYRDQPVTVRTAYAIHREDSVKLFFSSATPSCGEVVAQSRMLAPGEISFEVTRQQWSDGSAQLTTYFKGNTVGGADGVVLELEEIDPAEGGTTTGRLSGALEGIDDRIEVDGTFEAVSCAKPAESRGSSSGR